MEMHPDDRFHPPTSDDPYWTETCWFTFAVPERGISGQLYPFFRPNLGISAGAAFIWDDSGSQPWNCLYGKNFWHLPMPEGDLTDFELANGIRYRCLTPLSKYKLDYLDPDAGDVAVDLTFEAICEPNYLAGGHLDQPGRYTGTLRLGDETIPVDAFGMRDRSWGVRSQFGSGLHNPGPDHGGYTYATASERDAFHCITMDAGEGCVVIHGFLLRDGEYAKLASGRRDVLERRDGHPTRVRVEARDELGRDLVAEGECQNALGVHLNPNLFTWNCLTRWSWGSIEAWGEDHDNWSARAIRRFIRSGG
ncbi:hypothetical protein MK489_11720 [Myxococcota bacterium]|nr:hypothetical protein [Myxococcota bacterium]